MAEVCVALWGVAGARGRVLSPPPRARCRTCVGTVSASRSLRNSEFFSSAPWGTGGRFFHAYSLETRAGSLAKFKYGFRIANRRL